MYMYIKNNKLEIDYTKNIHRFQGFEFFILLGPRLKHVQYININLNKINVQQRSMESQSSTEYCKYISIQLLIMEFILPLYILQYDEIKSIGEM